LASQTRVSRSTREKAPTPPDDEVVIDLRDPPPAPSGQFDPLRPLVGKVAVVTGGGGAVGRAVALSLLAAGARVCVLDSDVNDLRTTTSAAEASAPILYLQCDLGSVTEVAGAADFIARFDRPVDVLVHAADVHVAHDVTSGVVADLDEQYLVNLRGPYLITQHLMAQLRQGPGHIVFVRPWLGEINAEDTQYAMTHAGVGALADGLRDELGSAGLRVSTIHVGLPGPGVDPVEAVDVADCVMGALEMPARVELSNLQLRPRPLTA
jgi:NAD(P)-dependent dehydrogenase (short-subunit alcohol dehydrogenase family)